MDKNCLPISTAYWDPKWFHGFKTPNSIFKDKRGVYNGFRIAKIPDVSAHECPCEVRHPEDCNFLKHYYQGLNDIGFDTFIQDLEKKANLVKNWENLKEEPDIILIVYEVPNNPCSERVVYQRFFEENGIKLEEWKKK